MLQSANNVLTQLALAVGLLALGQSLWAAEPYKTPRTFYDQPDLQGTWTNGTFTTLERPDDIESLVLSETEARAMVAARNEFYAGYDEPEKVDGKLAESTDPGGYNTFWMDEGSNLAVVDGEYRSSIIVHPEDGQIPYKWTAFYRRYRDLIQLTRMDGPELRPLGERCIVGFGSTGGPPMLPVLYNNNYQIVQNKDHVLVLVEMNHDVRTVRLNSTHPPASVKKWLGDSIGWWEGDTLVVETTNFHPGQGIRASLKHLIYATDELKVTERFTRTSDKAIKYEFAMDDPNVYSEVWRGELPFRKHDEQIYEYACHEGNYAMPGILAGARREEADGVEQTFIQKVAEFVGD